MHDDPIPDPNDFNKAAVEAWYWRYIDMVTSLCPVCAFVRGTLFGATLAVGVLWLM